MSQFDPAHYSKRYKRALSLAIVLFLGTLTASILIMILSTADRHSLEGDYRATLTAIADTATESAIQAAGEFPFRWSDLSFSAAAACDTHILAGLIRDEAGEPLDYISVHIWGDFVPDQQISQSGAGAAAAPGRWQVDLAAMPELSGELSRHVWVQLAADQGNGLLRYLSLPVEVIFEVGDCARNQADIVFDQIAPLE